MTARLEALLRFVWDFVIEDDRRIAPPGAAVALGIPALVANTAVSALWILPVIVAILLGGSVGTVARQRSR